MATRLDLEAYQATYSRRPYLLSMLIASDQWVNAALGGYIDETLSSRCYRCREAKWRWKILERLVNGLFFWDHQTTPAGVLRHCQLAFLGELAREHLPSEFRLPLSPG